MSNIISKFADVHPHAVLGEGVRIGPFCSIGANAKIGAGSILDSNVTVTGHAIIGKNNRLFPGVVIGAEPQDVSYQGSPTQVVIGENVLEIVINRGAERGWTTSIGSNGYFMACSPRMTQSRDYV